MCHQIFSPARDFRNCLCCEKYLEDIYTIASIWCANICPWTLSVSPRNFHETVRFRLSEQTMSADKYPRRMEAVVYLLNTRSFNSFYWLSHHRIWAIIPCITNMVSISSFLRRFYACFILVFNVWGGGRGAFISASYFAVFRSPIEDL